VVARDEYWERQKERVGRTYENKTEINRSIMQESTQMGSMMSTLMKVSSK
jgi:hypothetical protein